ncbi:MAG: MaoC family dehydratase N-terminal domain-containing protein, partial [Nocardioides sp.]|nr:MaoC family dehydratase N-terminal domain-containing protein [Nocardioides sp.]
MPIDPDKAIGAALPEQRFSWTSSDVLLYHLAVGAGQRPGDAVSPSALRYTLDDDSLVVLPSFGVVAPTFHVTEPPALDLPGCDIDLAKVLHGSQEISVSGPIPTSGEAVVRTRIAEVWDKGKAAVIVQEGIATTLDGDPLWTARSSIFCRGEGGFGGSRGPSTSLPVPDRAPDATTSYTTREEQALLYRLCGDRNPL